MNRYISYIILLILSSISIRTFSQATCTNPLPPVLTSVSVQPETGNTNINWTLSPSSDVAAYIVYSYWFDQQNREDVIDTIWNPYATSFTVPGLRPNYMSVSYTVQSFREPRCISGISNVINTIFTEASIDTCNKKILVKWKSYPSQPIKVTDYSIIFSVNGSSFIEAGKAGPSESSYILTTFSNDANYCFVVKANLEGGLFSTSNKACLSTKMQRPPGWINADYASVNDKNLIELSFSVDPLSELTRYRIERKTDSETEFSSISQIETGSKQLIFVDKSADPSRKNYYRLLAINNCGNPITSSNQSCNIVLNKIKQGSIINISWDPYKYWLGEVSGYKVFMNTGDGFHEESSVSSSDTTFSLDYSSVMYKMTGNNLCFYVSASEAANPHGITGETSSAGICTEIVENITVPTAFTPDNDLINDLFKPILSFTPSSYKLIISDRKNNILFESTDHLAAWDGTRGGSTLPEGVYIWFLRVTSPSGKAFTKNGTVTIIKNR